MFLRDAGRADQRFWIAFAFWSIGWLLFTLAAFWLAWIDDSFDRGTAKPALAGLVGIVAVIFGLGELWHRLRHGPQPPGRRVKRQDAPAPIRRRSSRR